ncbi:hypothetical protein BGZ59_009087 [Podila verticillata]|nr:hypothetical protein BGZ59_009087 [Podila verticillata]
MRKSLVLLMAVYSNVAFGFSWIKLTDNAGNIHEESVFPEDRFCLCLKNTQTATISGVSAGTIRLFSSSDCTGNYQTIYEDDKTGNAYWVNSVSWGKSGIPSLGPDGCPNYYA